MDYILEIKQTVDYPRVRIHRDLIRKLMADSRLSTRGSSKLFEFMILCSYVNFRTSKKKVDAKKFLIGPGEWMCSLKEMAGWFRVRWQHQALAILDYLKEQKLISYSILPGTRIVRYRILDWADFNTVLEYECPCQKDRGFFFFPICYADRLIAGKVCSELDAMMDLWLATIYKDERVMGSDIGPVVYFRNATGDPMTNYSYIATRWGRSKATICRMLGKLDEFGYVNCLNFSGNIGTAIYLNGYLSTMFNVADVSVDKAEVAFALKLRVKIEVPEVPAADAVVENGVSKSKNPVSKELLDILAEKALQMLMQQGFACCGCSKNAPKLYALSDACGKFTLEVVCRGKRTPGSKKRKHRFELKIVDSTG
jgi:hypothetical protein